MTLRDLLLVLGAVPPLGVVAWRLAAEAALVATPPPPDALPASLAAFGVVFLVYVALTLRAIARATRDILARESDGARSRAQSSQRTAAVSDFAIHIDRSNEIDLRAGDEEPEEPAEPIDPGSGPGQQRSAAARSELFGEVSDLLTRIPSARSR